MFALAEDGLGSLPPQANSATMSATASPALSFAERRPFFLADVGLDTKADWRGRVFGAIESDIIREPRYQGNGMKLMSL
jgi:hypothetical protein